MCKHKYVRMYVCLSIYLSIYFYYQILSVKFKAYINILNFNESAVGQEQKPDKQGPSADPWVKIYFKKQKK